ncbi:MAG: ABC transporter permease [Bacteroidales bacterium]|nr:ABC transporter permease [Bacteroidales bacterium]
MNLLKIAWRNLWRNRRRTIITASSILFAVFFVILMRSFQLGTYGHMIKLSIESYMGFLQVQHEDYLDDMTIDNSFESNIELIGQLDKMPGIKAVVPRLETFALASTGDQTKGVAVVGVDPGRELNLSNPNGRLVQYRVTPAAIEKLKEYGLPEKLLKKLSVLKNSSFVSSDGLRAGIKMSDTEAEKYLPVILEQCSFNNNPLVTGDDGVLVSDRLAKFLQLTLGDTLILMGQGYQGATAAGLYPVRGIIKIPAPDLDNKLIYMDINKARELYNLEGRVTSIAINLHDNSDQNMLKTKNKILAMVGNDHKTVKTWKEFNKVLLQQIQSDNQSGKLILGLLYFIVFFGIFGTVLMMIHERKREFGILVSIGMKRYKLAVITMFEMMFMGLIGVFSGIVLSLPLLYLGHEYPIRFTGDMARIMEDMGFDAVMPLEWVDMYVLWQGLIVAFMVILSCLYPLRKVFSLKEVEALRA